MTGLPQQVISCPDCGRVLLIIYDLGAPDLPAEMAAKVDGHRCPPPPGPPVTRGRHGR